VTWSCTVEEAQQRCSSEEFTYWLAYYRLEPWGEERADLRMAILDSLFYNANRGKGSGSKKPKDFMLDFERNEQQSVEEMMLTCQMIAAANTKPPDGRKG
jgi:hypothetical protein